MSALSLPSTRAYANVRNALATAHSREHQLTTLMFVAAELRGAEVLAMVQQLNGAQALRNFLMALKAALVNHQWCSTKELRNVPELSTPSRQTQKHALQWLNGTGLFPFYVAHGLSGGATLSVEDLQAMETVLTPLLNAMKHVPVRVQRVLVRPRDKAVPAARKVPEARTPSPPPSPAPRGRRLPAHVAAEPPADAPGANLGFLRALFGAAAGKPAPGDVADDDEEHEDAGGGDAEEDDEEIGDDEERQEEDARAAPRAASLEERCAEAGVRLFPPVGAGLCRAGTREDRRCRRNIGQGCRDFCKQHHAIVFGAE